MALFVSFAPRRKITVDLQGKILLVGGGVGAIYAAGRMGYFGNMLGAPPQVSEVNSLELHLSGQELCVFRHALACKPIKGYSK